MGKYRHLKIKCQKRGKIIKSIIPHYLSGGDNIEELIKLKTPLQALDYITPVDPDGMVYPEDQIINMTLNLDEIHSIDSIVHISLDMHVRPDLSYDIIFNMSLTQVVEVEINGEKFRQYQQYLYQGHRYTFKAREWNKIGERWDEPSVLGVLTSATNFHPDEIELEHPKLEISILGIIGRLEVDQTIQLHVKYF